MSARKPSALNRWDEHTADRRSREHAEMAMMPKTQLSKVPPAALKGHKQAGATWRRLIDLYQSSEGTIVTAFDQDLLAQLCLVQEELHEIWELRAEVKKLWVTHSKLLAKTKPKAEALQDYYSALAQANALLTRWQGLDARFDNKRKLLHSLMQSCYLSPRSRAGAAPKEKGPEEPIDEMEQLLEEN